MIDRLILIHNSFNAAEYCLLKRVSIFNCFVICKGILCYRACSCLFYSVKAYEMNLQAAVFKRVDSYSTLSLRVL